MPIENTKYRRKDISKSIYDLKLHELGCVDEKGTAYVIRVPGGWVYSLGHGEYCYNDVFVPYSDEFNENMVKYKFGDTPLDFRNTVTKHCEGK